MHHISMRGQAAWEAEARAVQASTLLVQAQGPYFMGLPMMSDDDAEHTLRLIPQAQRATARGNHFSMLFGAGAQDVQRAVARFLED